MASGLFVLLQDRWTGKSHHYGKCYDTHRASFDNVHAAEQRARTWARKYRTRVDILYAGRQIAETVVDALDRVWVEVHARPGEPTLL